MKKSDVSPEKMEFLINRKNEMIKLVEEGYEFEQFNPNLPEAEFDDDLDYYYLNSNAILDLIEIRREKGLTQADVAAMIGTKQAAVSRFERYSCEPTLKFIHKYARALGAKLLLTPYGKYTIVMKETEYKAMEELANRKGFTINQEFVTAVVHYAVSQPSYLPAGSFGSIPSPDWDKINLINTISINKKTVGAV